MNEKFLKQDGISDSESKRADEIRSKLLRDRIVFLGTPIDDSIANLVIAELLFLEAEDPSQDINLYINSPGGAVISSMAIYDTMNSIGPDVTTICVGQANGTAALLVASGMRGKRFALPHARFQLVPMETSKNQLQTIELLEEMERLSNIFSDAFGKATRQQPTRVRYDMQMRLRLDANEALNYGIIDALVSEQ